MKVAIHTPTEIEYEQLNKRLNEFGYTELPKNCYNFYLSDTCIDLDMVDKVLYYSSHDFFTKKGYKIIKYCDLKEANFKIEIQL